MSSERTPPPDLDRVEQGSTGDAIVADEGRQAPDDANRQPPNEAADASEDRPLPAATVVALSKPAPITTGRASAEQGSPEDPLVHPASPSESVTSEDGSGNEQLVPNPIAETIPAIADLSANDATQIHRSETTPVAATGGHQISVDVVPHADDINAPGADGPWMAISATVTGAAHRRAGIGSQDAIQWEPHEQRRGRWLAMAVADGHGSAKHYRSDVGAKLAVEVVLKILAAVPISAAPAQVARYVSNVLATDILRSWQQCIQADWTEAQKAFSLSDWKGLPVPTGAQNAKEGSIYQQYGTTLLAVLATNEYLVCARNWRRKYSVCGWGWAAR